MSYSSPVTANTPTKYHDPLPEKTDVVIIGGGVIGVFSALYLIRAGYNVVICEKGVIAGEQSSRNWGWIRQQGRDEDELPIMMEAIDLWQAIDEELGGATGFKRNGLIYLAKKEKKLQQRKASIAMAKKMGLEGAALSTQQLSDTIGIAKAKLPWIGGTHTPNDARAEPWLAIPAVAQLIHSEGVKIKEHCAVRSLDIQHNKVLGVVTEHGYIATQHVVVCAGAWSSVFLQNHNIIIPQLSVRATVAQTTPIDMTYQGNAADEELAFGKRNDGGYSLALTDFLELFIGPDAFRHLLKWLPVAKTSLYEARYKPFPPNHYPDSWFKRHWTAEQQTIFEKMRVLNPTPPAHKVALIKSRLSKRFPHLEFDLLNAWSGMIDAMPDLVPIVDRIPTCSNAILATGMSGHGFGIGPGFAKIICQMIKNEPVEYNMQRFRFNRFQDGSQLKVGPSI